MIHDNFFEWFRSHENGRLLYEQFLISKHIAPIYFEKMRIEPELSDSYNSFVESRDGDLIAPYENMLLVLENGTSMVDEFFYCPPLFGYDVTHLIVMWNKHFIATGDDTRTIIGQCILTKYARLSNGHFFNTAPVSHIGWDRIAAKMAIIWNKTEAPIYVEPRFANIPEYMENRERSNALNIARQSVMMMNLPHYEQLKTEVPPKILKSRLQKGHPSITQFIKIKMRDEMERAIQENGGFYGKKRPHWRRGHCRTIKALSKKVWVRPCMVNWNGDPIEPKAYIVQNDTVA